MAQPFAAKPSTKEDGKARELIEEAAPRNQKVGSAAIQYAEDAVRETDAVGVGSSMREVLVPVDVIPEMSKALIQGILDSYALKPDEFSAALRGMGTDPYATAAEALGFLFEFGLMARVTWVRDGKMSAYHLCPGYFENDLFQSVYSLIGEVSFAGFRLIPVLKGATEKPDVSKAREAMEVQHRLFGVRLLKKAPQWMLKPRAGMVSGMVVYVQRHKAALGDVVGHTDMIDRAEALLGALIYKDLIAALGQPGFIYGTGDAFIAAMRRLGQKATGIL